MQPERRPGRERRRIGAGILSVVIVMAVGSSPALGQDGRSSWSVHASFSHIASADLFRHVSTPMCCDIEYLAIPAISGFGVGLQYGFSSGWLIDVAASHGRGRFEYGRETPTGGVKRWDDVGATSIRASVGRRIRIIDDTSAGVSLEAGMQRYSLGKQPEPQCPPSICPGFGLIDPWESEYRIPIIGIGTFIERRLLGRIGLHGRANYSTGRANTASFWHDFLPEFDAHEAPRRYRVNLWAYSAGLTVRT